MPFAKRARMAEDGGATQRDEDDADVLARVRGKAVTLGTIQKKLETHVDQYDATQALEFVTRLGRVGADAKPVPLFLAPKPPTMAHDVVTLAHPAAEWALLRAACHPDSRV